jgi:uncharacterized membrane protein
MATLQEKIDEITRHISELAAQQNHLGKQLLALMNELDELKAQVKASVTTSHPQQTVAEKVIEYKEVITAPSSRPAKAVSEQRTKEPLRPAPSRKVFSFEEFIGKNLASKVGILVTLVGIFIGARYAIEHDLVSPPVRILSGYACGLALMAIAFRLKKKYDNYSAVLMGGGLSVLYFITYIAWSFYALLPQVAAFAIMLVITSAIVYMAVWYNQVIIAHLAQVGAYAIPFLLSNNTGQYEVLFTYMLIINAGILVLSFYKYWKSLFYIAYIASWLIYGVWYVTEYNGDRHFTMAFVFLCAFFLMFYATFLAYKLIRKELYNIGDVLLLLSNAFIFYGLGFGLLNDHSTLHYWPALFTVANAFVHLTVSIVIKRLQLADKSLYYFVLGLVVVFLTIAVPVQLDGNWVTLLWAAEAVVLFVIGRTRQAELYEKLAVGLVILAFGSLIQDRVELVHPESILLPFQNMVFYTGLFVIASFGVITWVGCQRKWKVAPENKTGLHAFFDFIVPVLLILTSYYIPFLESRDAILRVEGIWAADPATGDWKTEGAILIETVLFLYSAAFGALILFINQRWIRNRWLAVLSLIGIGLLCCLLLIGALPFFNEMTIGYFKFGSHSHLGAWHVVIRYATIGLVVWIMVMGTRIVKQYISESILRQGWNLLLYVTTLGMISYEYINWTTIAGGQDQYRIGLSIVWGLFALALVIYGIRKKQKYMRLAAIVLFVITILKLFLYDLAESGTLTKTISFITLGVILLMVSYLYNRYKEVLFGSSET